MHCLTVIYPTPEDKTAFREYYETRHLPLASRLPGMTSMHHAFPDAIGPGDVFCIFQAEFASGAALEQAMMSEVGQEVAQDVPNYSPRGAQVFHFAKEGPGHEHA
jgi:uncharacterized protein (TIGR02118 family)